MTDQLDTLLRLHRLDDLRATLEPVRRALHLELTPDAVSTSRAGGDPDLPAGFAWPEHQGNPLTFFLQLELAEVAAHLPGSSELPATGLLSVFGDQEERVFVVHRFGPDAPLTPRRSPADGPAPCAIGFRAHSSIPEASTDAVHARLTALERAEAEGARAAAAPSQGLELDTRDWRERAAAPSVREERAFDRFYDLRDALLGTEHIGHQLLGYASSVQDDAVAEAGCDRLLLQLASDRALGWDFAGDGVLYLCISDADLRAARFDAVVAVMQR